MNQMSLFGEVPCRKVIGTQGAKAVSNGKAAEATIYCILKERGYTVEKQKFLGRNAYGERVKVDFVVYGIRGMERGLIIESKWQSSNGTADEKLPYLVKNIQEYYPYPAIVVVDGGGFREGAISYMRNQVDGKKLIAVFTFGEFLSWINQTL